VAATPVRDAPAGTAPAGATKAGAEDVGALMRAQRWPAAAAAAARLADPLALRLVTYYRILTPHAASLPEIDAFRAANPDWPQPATIERRREEALLAEQDDAAVLQSCAEDAPAGGAALARCASAMANAGQPGPAADTARAAWVAGPSNPAWESAFMRRWSDTIQAADTWRRFDRLAWTDTDGAQRLLPLLSPADRQRAQARLALRRDDPRAEALVAALPPADAATPGIVFEHVRWLLHARRDDAARDLLVADGRAAEQAVDADHRALFWTERDLAARRSLQAGDPADAYAVVEDTGQTAAETIGDAAFLAGWIALRQLGRPRDATRHFLTLRRVSTAAISRARADYWLARASLAAGEPAEARREAASAATYPFAYYGQLAAVVSGDDAATIAARITALHDPPWTPDEAADLVSQDLARAAIMLAAWGEPGRGAGFLLRLADLDRRPAELALIGHLAVDIGLPSTAVALARRAGRAGTVLPDTGWPMAASVDPQSLAEPALVLGVIRQESSFDPGEISPVGARGLMQLMPATAAAEARLLGVTLAGDALIADPSANIRLGSHYLAGLLGKFAGSIPLAVAAYNAGPRRVTDWLAAYGDPRHGANDMVDWIELIPLAETRNYVQRVVENTLVYRARLGVPLTPLPVTWTPSPA
jgi:soluble lytic murein transglycosylase